MSRDLLRRLAENARVCAANGRRVETCGAFQLFLSDATADYTMNYAIPVAARADWRAEVAGLAAAFAAAGRQLRLEFFPELQPELKTALIDAGAAVDMDAPLMVLPKGKLTAGAMAGRVLRGSDPEGIAALETVQASAFADATPEGQAAWRPALAMGIRTGGIRAAVLSEDGRPLSAATIMVGPHAGELAGVATRPEARGKGLAERVCRLLLTGFFRDSGKDIAWLSAAPDALGLYRKLGFTRVGTQLNMGKRPLPPEPA